MTPKAPLNIAILLLSLVGFDVEADERATGKKENEIAIVTTTIASFPTTDAILAAFGSGVATCAKAVGAGITIEDLPSIDRSNLSRVSQLSSDITQSALNPKTYKVFPARDIVNIIQIPGSSYCSVNGSNASITMAFSHAKAALAALAPDLLDHGMRSSWEDSFGEKVFVSLGELEIPQAEDAKIEIVFTGLEWSSSARPAKANTFSVTVHLLPK
jgi:hypothetical protein